MSTGRCHPIWMALLVIYGLAGCQASRPASSSRFGALSRSANVQAAHTDEGEEQETATVTPSVQLEADALPMPEDKATSRWAKLFGGFGKPKRIPLPRTDLESEDMFGGANMSKSSSVDDF